VDSSSIKSKIKSWAQDRDIVKQVFIIGSRARSDYKANSDIDIALVLYRQQNDSNVLATWMFEKEHLRSSLQELLPYKLDLQLYDGEKTKTIHNGINESSILILDKVSVE